MKNRTVCSVGSIQRPLAPQPGMLTDRHRDYEDYL